MFQFLILSYRRTSLVTKAWTNCECMDSFGNIVNKPISFLAMKGGIAFGYIFSKVTISNVYTKCKTKLRSLS